ncbi:MAG TPA: hypothetical protein VFG72_01110 [Marmoricola sp.]|nr:hypothetical protein [Marmoricola sp.]
MTAPDARRRGVDRTQPPAIVVGLDCITGLQTSRLLAARGVPVIGIVADLRHWATRTKSCVDVVQAPQSGPLLVDVLRDAVRHWGPRSVVIPCTDAAVHYLSSHRCDLPAGMALPLADHDTVDLLMDKLRFAEYAEAAGLPVPRTTKLRSRDDALEAAETHAYPCVLKPPGKSAAWLSHTTAKAFSVADPRAFMQVYDTVSAWAPVLLIQEWVSGPETELYSCNACFDEQGSPLVTFVARKVRQWPPEIGTSASGEECRNDAVLEATVKLFGGLGFQGLAYLEMKRDSRTGLLKIIEPNVGRPTGRSAIAEAGGVELVLTAYRHALGLPLPAARTQRYGDAKWLDLRRDAQAAVVAHRRGGLSLVEWVRWLSGPKAHAIWARNDPMPFAADLLQSGRTGAKRLVERHRAAPAGGQER